MMCRACRYIMVYLCLALVMTSMQGCVGALAIGGTTAALAHHDRRTLGILVEDQNIEFKAAHALRANPKLGDSSNINVVSYNRTVLLTGQCPNATLRALAGHIVQRIENVKHVQNEISIAAPSAFSARGSDTWITTKVKTSLFQIDDRDDFDPTRVKVKTENGTVYLMGLVTREEADAAVSVIRRVRGVQRVVKVFEYIP